MATTNHTPNFNLPQWTANDMVGVMANLNPAFQTIDEKLNAAVVNAENASTTASAANKTASDASKLVSEVDTDVTTLQADVLTLQNLANSLTKTLNDSLTWDKVSVVGNDGLFTDASLVSMFMRRDKKILNIYGYAPMNKVLLSTGMKLFDTTITPTTDRDAYLVCEIRNTNDGSTYKALPLGMKFKTTGEIESLDDYDYTNSKDNPIMYFQCMINTVEWFS